MAEKEGSRRRPSGPTAEQWERYKSTIIDYYLASSLKELQATMKKKHGFIATKRMYDTRFRKWGITKIIKTREKEQMLLEMNRSPTGSRSPMEETAFSLSEKDYNKLKRYEKSRKRSEKKETPLLSGAVGGSAPESDSDLRDDFPTSSGDSMQMEEDTGLDSMNSSRSTSRSDREMRLQGTDPTIRDLAVSARLSQTSLETPQSRHQGLILHLVKSYYSSRLEKFLSEAGPSDVLSVGTSRTSKSYWSNVKNGTYLWKIASPLVGFSDDHQRGEQALHTAKHLAGAALQTEPSDFVFEMLSTLSPWNMSARPQLRAEMFNHLATQASARLSTSHPIALICAALQADPDDSLISRNALVALLDLFSAKLGRNHPSTYKVMLAVITQMRRSGSSTELNAARGFAERALALATEDHGPDSNEARTAAVELAHVLTKLGDHGRTLRLRMDVVTQKPQEMDEDDIYRRDGTAAHTMEDIAEYYCRFGYVMQCSEWLRRARDIAFEVWGAEHISTLHILDKLEKLEKGDVAGQVADGQMMVAAH